jgi:hypothetical protein
MKLMKIIGLESNYKMHVKEPGCFFGYNAVLKWEKSKSYQYTPSALFGGSESVKIREPKIYLHIPKDAWSTFTGTLKERCLPWLWRSAYLDPEDGTQPRRILVCTIAHQTQIPESLKKVLGQSLFSTQLINKNFYEEILGKEFIRVPTGNEPSPRLITSFLGSRYEFNSDRLCHIFRTRGLFSSFKYSLLKQFSSEWKEAVIKINDLSEKMLIKKNDEAHILSFFAINNRS